MKLVWAKVWTAENMFFSRVYVNTRSTPNLIGVKTVRFDIQDYAALR